MRRYDYSQLAELNQYEEPYPLEIPRRYDVSDLVELADNFEWQVTYKFTSSIRHNRFGEHSYGADAMTFRRLYIILCEHFNGGNYFIEDYFEKVYPYRLKDEADEFLEDINARIEDEYFELLSNARFTKKGTVDKRYKKTLKKLSEYKIMASETVKTAGDLLSERVKLDIVECLQTGIIPLAKTALSPKTVKQRAALGFPSDTIFFASGQLINNIKVYFRLEKKQSWLSQYF